MKHTLILAIGAILLFIGCQQGTDTKNTIVEEVVPTKKLVAGPMLGYIEHREAVVWIEVALEVFEAEILYYPIDSPNKRNLVYHNLRQEGSISRVHFYLPELAINTTYQYDIYLDGEKQEFTYPTQFKTRTLWEYRTDAPDLTFLFGSCNYINDSIYDRAGEPYGQGTKIFETLAKQPADFMLWLGDNTYYRPADYSSVSGMAYRNRHTRSVAALQPLLAAMSHYAIWDDHDYGPNDGDKTFDLKQESLRLFKEYWGNKTYGEAGNAGVYSKIQVADAEFFLLDDRYHRSPNTYPDKHSEKEFLGKRQMQWLKEGLMASNRNVNFRFIVVGNQVLNPVNEFECFRHFTNEWEELMEFIVQQRIEGVVFLSGDRHMTEMNFFQPGKEFYRLYDVTSSPLTSRAFTNIADDKEYSNPARLDSTLLPEQNFIKATITGSFLDNDRTLTFQAIDADGNVRWTKAFHEKDLKMPNGE
jgi:alkaline phosphatase D